MYAFVNLWHLLAELFIRIKNLSDKKKKKVVEEIKTRILSSLIFFSPENRAIEWKKSTLKPGRL